MCVQERERDRAKEERERKPERERERDGQRIARASALAGYESFQDFLSFFLPFFPSLWGRKLISVT